MNGPGAVLAVQLLACLKQALEDAGRAVCAACLYHGQSPMPADWCDCTDGGCSGQAWVRIASGNPEPAPVSWGPNGGPCPTGWRVEFELGVLRCVDAGGPNGEPPACEARSAEALAAWADAEVLRGLPYGCAPLEDYTVQLGMWRPLGPSGGCAGSVQMVTVTL